MLVGVTRISKTPLSIYLAYRGWKVANVPIALGVELPSELFTLPCGKVVGLMVRPERLAELRQARLEKLGTKAWGYTDLDHVKQEIAFSYMVLERRKDWPLVDVTTKPIE